MKKIRGLHNYSRLLNPYIPVTITAAILSCIQFHAELTADGNAGTWINYIFYCFRGISKLNFPLKQETFSLPISWLLLTSGSLMSNLFVLTLTPSKWKSQILIRSGSRRKWFAGECAICVANTFFYFVTIWISVAIFTLCTESHLENALSIAAVGSLASLSADVVAKSLTGILAIAIVLVCPLLSMVSMNLLQLFLLYAFGVGTSFLICVSSLVIALFIDCPFLAGNGAMLLRNTFFTEGGLSIEEILVCDVGISMLCIWLGMKLIQRKDIF